ncbi:uncharacterized protein LOC124167886 isoform X2 [Ischnura elegans]|uniref:uncharacterized protein LOC124167886 isoform X2 n=1 Tax=Ischnura elegans TaxID=197161 RepID=UPI001ED86BC3|nr:uncharacterized protein LOC124167886 isoform X2 [Ischnura elegans]
MKRDIRYMNSRGLSNQNSVEDWLGGSNFMQDPMEADSNPNFPSSQDWDHYAAWNTNGPHYPVDPKRSPFHTEMTAPSRLGGHYMPYANMCPRPDGPAPKPGVEPWHYAMPTMTANSSSSGIYSSRNSDAFRPPPHVIPVPQFPRLPQHQLFAPVSGGGPIPSGGGPPSLLPPPFLFTPHHPSSLPSQAYPPHERSSRAHSSASLFGTPGSNYPTMPPVGVNNPDSTNYAEQGCYSLPVTTAACSETQIQISQMIRPKNQVAVSKASVAPTNSDAGKRGCHHRRTLSDPGLVNSLNLSEFTSAPSHGAQPPPPPPALRLDAWLKGCRLRDSSEAKLDEPSLSSSMTHDNNQWFHSHEEKKCPQMGLVDKGDDEQTPRANMSGQSSMGSDGVCGAGLKLSATAHQAKVVCCCNGWSVPMKLVEEVTALKECNRKLARELRETRKELDDLKVMLPNADSLKHDGSMSWQYPGVDYRPGMIAELVQELREASRLREEAFLSHVQSAVMSQGASCSCGAALMPDGGGALGAGKRKMMCWWWGKSKWNKPGHSQSASTCSPLSSSDVLQLDQDCEQKKLSMRLRRIEERLNSYKISGETEMPRSSSLQETDFSLSSAKGAKVPPSEDINQRLSSLQLSYRKSRAHQMEYH